MKLINSLIPFIGQLGHWLHFTNSGKIDHSPLNYASCLANLGYDAVNYVNQYQNGIDQRILFFTMVYTSQDAAAAEFTLLGKEQQLKDTYLIFIIGIVMMVVFVVFIAGKHARNTKRNNEALKINNKVMIAQNEYLQQTLSTLEERNEENTRILQVIAHDLRSPMAAIVGLSSFMIDEHNLAEEDLEVIGLINTSGVDSLKFINEILDGDSPAIEIKKETVDLELLLTYCITQLQYKANEKRQNIILKSTAVTLKVNREKIWRVISNLITNAIKFSPHESKISVYLKLIGEKAIISVKDKGIGIPEELRDKIFSMNAQRKREGTAGEKSFGLGLAIAKQNIEAHGGTLSFESQVGKGATFFIELPLS